MIGVVCIRPGRGWWGRVGVFVFMERVFGWNWIFFVSVWWRMVVWKVRGSCEWVRFRYFGVCEK
jgi:hypothetical protein